MSSSSISSIMSSTNSAVSSTLSASLSPTTVPSATAVYTLSISASSGSSSSSIASNSSSGSSASSTATVINTVVNSVQRLPFSQANIFIDFRGISRGYFIGDNPWKLSTYNNFDKVYRFCWVCGINRFADNEWNRNRVDISGPGSGARWITCMDVDCSRELTDSVNALVSERHFRIETDIDRKRIAAFAADAEGNPEFFEEIAPVTVSVRNDRVYPNESAIPIHYRDMFLRLENYPVHLRIVKIDFIKFEYADEHNLIRGVTTDPFLKALAQYRARCIEIVHLQRSLVEARARVAEIENKLASATS